MLVNTTFGNADVFDAFICGASFETRSLVVAHKLTSKCARQLAFVCETVDVRSSWPENGSALRSLFGAKTVSVELSTSDPLLTFKSFQVALERCISSGIVSLGIDITTFTHEALMILLSLLDSPANSSIKVVLFYAPAKAYSYDQLDSDKWLSAGMKEIRSVLGYPGILLPGLRLNLTILMGFEKDRALNLIDAFEPNSVWLGLSDSSISQEHERLNKYFASSLFSGLTNLQSFDFSSVDILETVRVLKSKVRDKAMNQVVAPLNTKISTVAVSLVAAELRHVQVCYVQPEIYNTACYSEPLGTMLRFDLSEIKHLISSEVLSSDPLSK